MSERILVVDDDAPIRRTFDEHLTDAGYEVRTAADAEEALDTTEVVLQELTVMPGSRLIGRSAQAVRLRTRYGINLLALSRQGQRTIKRLRATGFKAGDLLMLQGPPGALLQPRTVLQS